MNDKPIDACIYCDRTDDLTRDHIPPKCIFPAPRSSDLITVPACRPCNKSYEKDDEYFRVAVTIPGEHQHDASGQKVWKEGVIKGTMRRSARLKNQIVESIRTLDMRSPAGLYLGSVQTVRMNRARLDRVAKRIVTGLHWHHFGKVPAADVDMTVAMGPDPVHPGRTERVARDLLGGRPWIEIGGGAFRYGYAQVPEQPDWQAWLLLFYSAAAVLVLLTKNDPPDAEVPSIAR